MLFALGYFNGTDNDTSTTGYGDYYDYNYLDDYSDEVSTSESVRTMLANPFIIVMIVLCFLGIIANCLSILATVNIPNGQTTHSKLIISLALADLFIVISVLFHFTIKAVFPNGNYNLHHHHPKRLQSACAAATDLTFKNMSLLATLLNLLAMAIDHNIAIMKPLHYPLMMSKLRGNCMIISVWILAVIGGCLDFIIGAIKQANTRSTEMDAFPLNFCESVNFDNFDVEIVVFALIILVLVVMTYVYLRIYFEVKKLIRHDHVIQGDSMHSNKAMVTTLLIVGTFILCWVPNCMYQIIMSIQIEENYEHISANFALYEKLNNIFFILMLSNSICDPLIYAVRLRDIQLGYKNLKRKLCRKSRYTDNQQNYQKSRRDTTTVLTDLTTDNGGSKRSNSNSGNDDGVSDGTEMTPVTPLSEYQLNWDFSPDPSKETSLCLLSQVKS